MDRTCAKCGKVFPKPCILKAHLERKTPCEPITTSKGGAYDCKFCGRSYSSQVSLARHVRLACKVASANSEAAVAGTPATSASTAATGVKAAVRSAGAAAVAAAAAVRGVEAATANTAARSVEAATANTAAAAPAPAVGSVWAAAPAPAASDIDTSAKTTSGEPVPTHLLVHMVGGYWGVFPAQLAIQNMLDGTAKSLYLIPVAPSEHEKLPPAAQRALAAAAATTLAN